MPDAEQINEQRPAAAFESLTVADADRAQARFNYFSGAGSGAWNAWTKALWI